MIDQVVVEEVLAEGIPVDLALEVVVEETGTTDLKCIKLPVVTAATSAKCHSDRLETDRFYVKIVSVEMMVVQKDREEKKEVSAEIVIVEVVKKRKCIKPLAAIAVINVKCRLNHPPISRFSAVNVLEEIKVLGRTQKNPMNNWI